VIGAVALVVGALTFAAAYVLLTTRRRLAVHRQLGHYIGAATVSRNHGRRISRSWAAEHVDAGLRRTGQQQRVALLIDRAGIDSSAGAFAALVMLGTAAIFVLLLVVTSFLWAFVGAVATPFVVVGVLTHMARRRTQAFEAQLPELLDMLSSSLKAGHGFDHALQNLASDVAEPAGREFRRVVAEVHLGRTLESALAELGERVQSEDLMFVLDAITVQRQVGGSLADLFSLVAETVRQREQFRRKLAAITGMVRASAKVLTALPIGALFLLSLVNRTYMEPLWTTKGGHLLLVIIAVMIIIGGLFLKRIGSVKA